MFFGYCLFPGTLLNTFQNFSKKLIRSREDNNSQQRKPFMLQKRFNQNIQLVQYVLNEERTILGITLSSDISEDKLFLFLKYDVIIVDKACKFILFKRIKYDVIFVDMT